MTTIDLFRARTARASLWVILAVAGFIPLHGQGVVPVNGTPPTLSPTTVNDGPGDQNDPHISGDWVSYTSDLAIRYYSFVTKVDAQIRMGASARDLLSDMSGSKIVFSRVISGVTTAVMVFDAATAAAPIEIDPALDATRLGSAIGGNTVAYIDFGLHANGELVIHDLTTSSSVRITTDTNPDQSPQVSPDGNVVTWEHCNSSLSNCDIWQAVQRGGVWNVSVVSSSPDPEANPDTNGTLVVYESFRNSKADIFWRPVTGGAEVRLQAPGFNQNPSISGDYIAFESRPTLGAATDVFVYNVVTNLLYRITDTPGVIEQLNDITAWSDGTRVVWASNEDGNGQRNIKAATFYIPAVDDTTPPVITPPADITVNANRPSGVAVRFAVQASDESGIASLVCAPPSGSVFPVGTSVVQCTAMDAAGLTSSASFNVTVNGSAPQIQALMDLARRIALPPFVRAKLLPVLRTALTDNRLPACAAVGRFILLVQSQPASAIPPATNAQVIADAVRVTDVMGCPN